MAKAIELMLEELHDNPRETNLKRCVIFGIVFVLLSKWNLSIDQVPYYPINGYSVAYDCAVTTSISFNRVISTNRHLA